MTALVAAPAYADATPDVSGKSGASTAAVAPRSGGSEWVQTDPIDFYHNFAGADRAYEQVSELPALTIPNPGVWEISYSARTNIGNPASASALYVHTAVFNNGALLPGSEALTGKTYDPGESSQDTIGQTVQYTFKAGDVVQLYGYRIGQQGSAGILSNGDGRTGITAHWVSF
ncbi:MAG TPA: hypothetical protein VFG87_17430 [Amycolatopsis sp.]|nr:hypothetical protein [Amycolatopsis sp.]